MFNEASSHFLLNWGVQSGVYVIFQRSQAVLKLLPANQMCFKWQLTYKPLSVFDSQRGLSQTGASEQVFDSQSGVD